MKRTDILFQKSVASKSRHISAGYRTRIADTLNSLPDVIPCVSEETGVRVITHRKNYRYISAVSAAAVIVISGSVCLHFGFSSGDGQKNNDARTTVRVTNMPVITSDQYENVKEPSVIYETSLLHTDNITTESHENNDTQSHDVAGDPQDINKNNISQVDSGKLNSNAEVTKIKKLQDAKQPSDKTPVLPERNPAVTCAVAVTVPEPVEEILQEKIYEGSYSYGKGQYQQGGIPEHLTGGNNVGSEPPDVPGDPQKESEKIEKEINKNIKSPEKMPEKAPDKTPEILRNKTSEILLEKMPENMPDNPEKYLPHIPEYENQQEN